MRRMVTMTAALLIGSGVAGVALSGPLFTDGPECIVVSPDGSMEVEFRVEWAGEPVVGEQARLIFDPGTPYYFCDGFVITGITDADGRVVFAPQIGGCAEGPGRVSFEIDPGAVTGAVYDTVGSPDSNADGQVALDDFVEFMAVFLSTGESCQDLDGCNDTVNLSDFVVFFGAFDTACP